MDTYQARYEKLNNAQRQAVDSIEGPLLVIAGPGTGKTELLSMRTASILQKTDTLPENILCLTFTDSGAAAMRERLAEIIGPNAYKVAIHTFHSFGTEVINQNAEFFYHGANFKPADELSSYELLTGIFDDLDHANPLVSKMNGEYTYLRDAMATISELKRAGLSSDELLSIVSANDFVLDIVEPDLTTVFAGKISTTMLAELVPIAERLAALDQPPLPLGITPLGNVLALSMAHAFDEAVQTGKTTPITAWRNEWMEKNKQGDYVFKSRKRHNKLRALASVYFMYLSRMEQAGLYDYDDMILNVVHGIETQPDLKYNLQEKFHYIMVDEFQDTNLAQLRILFDLTDNPALGGQPNIMAVGDDDQAIYSFQGADVNNIHAFRTHYEATGLVTLTDNYRSVKKVITHAREVIVQGAGRLETTIESLDKTLVTHHETHTSDVMRVELPSISEERAWVARNIAARIKQGASPSSITVLARRHSELIELLPHLYHHKILVNYERRDNVLDIDVIRAIELIASIAIALHQNRHDDANGLLPELLAHPAFAYTPELIWKVGLESYRNHKSWMEVFETHPELTELHGWLLSLAASADQESLERSIDTILGYSEEAEPSDYVSPIYHYYFSKERLENEPDAYLVMLEALRTIRQKLREYRPNEVPRLANFIEFIRMHRELGTTIMSIRRQSDEISGAINLMTAHKSKGLEFDTVYIINAVDTAWGERVRSRSRLISYPENLKITPAGNTYDERLRLFFVAMTRARNHLVISSATSDDGGKNTLPASFIVGTTITSIDPEVPATPEHLTQQAELTWRQFVADNPTASMKSLLAPQLETYKLSATHLNNFIDITRGGPTTFLLANLLKFPQARSAQASYGTAIHAALQRAHNYLAATGERKPIEDVLKDFENELTSEWLSKTDYAHYHKKGIASLTAFLASHYKAFNEQQKTELNFTGQAAVIDEARITGILDLADLTKTSIQVTDYKTGKPSRSWKGASDSEKVKLHKYKQQLMFYELLAKHSRDYSKLQYESGILQFIEPDETGEILRLRAEYSKEELETFEKLICAVWRCIMNLDFPDTSQFDNSYKGVLAFETYLIDKYC